MLAPLLVALALVSAKPNASFQPRSRPYDAVSYRLDVKINAEDDSFNNKVTMTLKAKKPLSEIELDAYNLDIASATVDGAPATFKTKADTALRTGTVTLKPAKPVAPGKDAVVEVTYS